MTAGEIGGTIGTDNRAKHISFLEVVVDTAEIG